MKWEADGLTEMRIISLYETPWEFKSVKMTYQTQKNFIRLYKISKPWKLFIFYFQMSYGFFGSNMAHLRSHTDTDEEVELVHTIPLGLLLWVEDTCCCLHISQDWTPGDFHWILPILRSPTASIFEIYPALLLISICESTPEPHKQQPNEPCVLCDSMVDDFGLHHIWRSRSQGKNVKDMSWYT